MAKEKSDRSNTSWYDIPRYYDIAMQDEAEVEIAFIKEVIEKYDLKSSKRRGKFPWKVNVLFDNALTGCKILEPACGTGRLIAPLVALDHEVHAFDLSEMMVTFAYEKYARATRILPTRLDDESMRNALDKASRVRIFVDDMTNFRLSEKFDLGICLLDSFRHLTTEETALSHLRSMARAIRRGGIYLLGLHLLPMDASLECTERWTQERKGTKVTTTFRVTSASRSKRIENIRVSTLVREKGKELRFRDEFPLRIYTAAQLKSLIAKVPEWRIESVHDYWYELDYPMKLDNEMSDTVLVLKRR